MMEKRQCLGQGDASNGAPVSNMVGEGRRAARIGGSGQKKQVSNAVYEFEEENLLRAGQILPKNGFHPCCFEQGSTI